MSEVKSPPGDKEGDYYLESTASDDWKVDVECKEIRREWRVRIWLRHPLHESSLFFLRPEEAVQLATNLTEMAAYCDEQRKEYERSR